MPKESPDYRRINVIFSRSNQKGMDERKYQNDDLRRPKFASVVKMKMSLVLRSSRCNKKWFVFVCKSVKKKEPLLKKNEDSTCLTTSKVEKNVLCDLLTCYLLGDGELAPETPHRNCNAKTYEGQKKHDNSFCNPSMKKDEIARKADFLASRLIETTHLRKIVVD
ncbi:hypothetical protein MRB53_020734 [Persea americana]|uniref:Uncharacterized protein n=1 Tax=Persea americana TaxID=3435 RepID=A0ACC2L246_PERAE|nr:hypothetical protein MRB53_020734 [Persea americana]